MADASLSSTVIFVICCCFFRNAIELLRVEMILKLQEQRQELELRLDTQRRHMVQREQHFRVQVDELRGQLSRVVREVNSIKERQDEQDRRDRERDELEELRRLEGIGSSGEVRRGGAGGGGLGPGGSVVLGGGMGMAGRGAMIGGCCSGTVAGGTARVTMVGVGGCCDRKKDHELDSSHQCNRQSSPYSDS